MAVTCAASTGLGKPANSYERNRAPLVQKPFSALPLGAVKPEGWLRNTLERMAEGMTGHLDEVYPAVVGPRNGWLGGDGDGWERGPYWIDGLLPLAWLLDNDALKQKAQPWIEWTLTHQQADGYLGPIPFETKPEPEPGLQKDRRRDWWPKMVMLKILQNYYTATGDKRVIDVLGNYFRYQLRELPKTPLDKWSFWGNRRGGDNLMVVLWLYNITGETYLLDLAKLVHSQTYDHTGLWLGEDSPLTRRRGMHCVNIAQGFKHPVVMYQVDGDLRHLQAVDKAYGDLEEHFGMPTGLYGGDEPLSSKEPTAGSEFCSAAEMMFSLETMVAITGRADFADRLERIAFNVLPTQATDDFAGKQYYSIVNQVVAAKRRPGEHPTDHGGMDLVFGVLSGYPCCTTNMHQTWPKLTQHLWMASRDGGLAAIAYAPCAVSAEVGEGKTVSIREAGDYPFGETVTFAVSAGAPVEFPLHLRIPGWCKKATIAVNGETVARPESNRFARVHREWRDGDKVTLHLPMTLTTSRWYADAVSLERGPLLFALRIGEDWKEVGREGSSHYYRECYPTGPWNYGILDADVTDMDKQFQIDHVAPVGDNPWTLDTAPVSITGRGVRIPQWRLRNQTAKPTPASPVLMPAPEPEPITLVPYGCTTVRVAEFPTVKKGIPPPPRLAELAEPSASHVFHSDTVDALNDGLIPREKGFDRFKPRFTWWGHLGGTEWVQYTFTEAQRVAGASVIWFDDTGIGQCRTPASWRLLCRDDGDWKPVTGASQYETAAGTANSVEFEPVTTDALRLEVQLRDGFSGGILEWSLTRPR